MNGNVRFEVPDYVNITSDEFDGAEMAVEYDSNFGGVVTVEGEATINPGRHAREWTTVEVDGREIRSNGHVFSEKGRHLGTVESVEAVLPHDVAVDLIVDDLGHNHDVDVGPKETVVQGWDNGVIEQEGFMAGTVSVHLQHVA